MKSRKVRRVGHVASMGKMRKLSKFWSETLKGIGHSEGQGVDGKIILNWIL
jgi:hypothetical protein